MVIAITRYRISDGQEFESEAQAIAAEARIAASNDIRSFLDANLKLRGRDIDQRNGREIVHDFLISNAADIQTMLHRLSGLSYQQPEQAQEREEPLQQSTDAQEEEQAQEPPAEAPLASKPNVYQQPRIKDKIVGFLEERARGKVRDMSAALGIETHQISPRLAELIKAGVVRKVTNKTRYNAYALQKKAATPVADAAPMITAEHAEYLRLVSALVDNPRSTFEDLQTSTGITHGGVVRKRIGELEQSGLVKRIPKGKGGKDCFVAVAPTRKNQMPPPFNSLSEAVVEAVREYPGSTAEELACRMMKSHTDVARRVRDLQRTSLRAEGEDSQRWYLKTEESENLELSEAEAHPS
jgi:DNA-binding Lrp family transcriptional regulator